MNTNYISIKCKYRGVDVDMNWRKKQEKIREKWEKTGVIGA